MFVQLIIPLDITKPFSMGFAIDDEIGSQENLPIFIEMIEDDLFHALHALCNQQVSKEKKIPSQLFQTNLQRWIEYIDVRMEKNLKLTEAEKGKGTIEKAKDNKDKAGPSTTVKGPLTKAAEVIETEIAVWKKTVESLTKRVDLLSNIVEELSKRCDDYEAAQQKQKEDEDTMSIDSQWLQ